MLEILKVIGIVILLFIILFIFCACKIASYSSILDDDARIIEESEKEKDE